MLFERQELREIICRTADVIELRNEYGRVAGHFPAPRHSFWIWTFSWAFGTGAAFGFLPLAYSEFHTQRGSHTTQRLKGEAEVNIAHPLVREHRDVWSK